MQLDLGEDVEFRRSGALQAIHTPEQYELVREQVKARRDRGHQVELLTTREARGIEPRFAESLLGAMYSPLRSQADPQKATRAFATLAERRGRPCADPARGDGARVAAPARGSSRTRRAATIVAGELVLAAGAWCGPLGAMLDLDIPIVPGAWPDVGDGAGDAEHLPDDLLGASPRTPGTSIPARRRPI